jgi:hypothetical protein
MDWLDDCRSQCGAENVAWLVRQFAGYVRSEVAGLKESDMVDAAIVGLALKDPQNLEAALRIGNSFDEIRRNVASIFLRCVQERLVEWVLQQGEDWEVVVKWDGGNWVEQPGKKWLPLLLRKRAWPELVGVAIQAEEPGPCKVFIGICGPTQDSWNETVSVNTQLYGEQNKFTGRESRQRIAKAMDLKVPRNDWWVQYDEYLRDANGQDVSDWREITTVTRLYSEKDAVCKHITGQMAELAARIGGLVIDAG